ncbi:MAG: hypothetical protein RIF37_00535 [Rhodospirillaceae bacterium]
MTSDIDIYRTAAVILKEHGDDAEMYAMLRADELLDAGDVEGQITFLKIVAAIREIENIEPTSSLH